MNPTVSAMRIGGEVGGTSVRTVVSSVAKSLSSARVAAPVSVLRRVDLPALV